MRNRSVWHRALITRLGRAWPESAALRPAGLCQVEIGLFLLEQVLPDESAMALSALMTGYPYLRSVRPDTTEQALRAVGVARHLLLHYKNRQDWQRVLASYAMLPERLRGYEIDAESGRFCRRDVSLAADRWEVYARTLAGPVPHVRQQLHAAPAGNYRVSTRKRWWTVSIPADLPLPAPPAKHDLRLRTRRSAFSVSWNELLETARWMDCGSPTVGQTPSWHRRLSRVRLEIPGPSAGQFSLTEHLEINDVLHLVGMVSSGKSTLMDVLTVYAARRGLQVTLVVGDVINALRRVGMFRQLGLAAAPVLGSSSRQRHLERLHRVLQAGTPVSPLELNDSGFDYLSTACGLDALRKDTGVPFAPGENPCRSLVAANGREEDDVKDTDLGLGCPLYGGCQQHRAARDLVSAQIWVATPASLVYTQVPTELLAERMRYAELVYRHSDLVIVDEADQVQVQLDSMFSPSQMLVGQGADAWLDNVLSRVDAELKRAGRGQFGEHGVDEWIANSDVARSATNRLYSLLRQEPRLVRWIERDYFTGWTLAEKLAREWSGKRDGSPATQASYDRLLREWDTFFDNPLGAQHEGSDHPLSALARLAVLGNDELALHTVLGSWLSSQTDLRVKTDSMNEAVVRLEFTLVLAVLGERLEQLIRRWRQVEAPLNLEGSSPLLFHRPPEDFAAVIPESPMGNVLGFQYQHPTDGDDHMGELRFFRCAGVGRWLLLHLHDLFESDGIAGPNVLLLSGTSWAGASPGYHVQIPVGGVLRAPEDEVSAIATSTFRFAPIRDSEGNLLAVSGSRPGSRLTSLQAILSQLARRGQLGDTPSLLERERDNLPAGRRRILALVGSYEEARQAYAHLLRVRPDWRGQIRHLVADDADFGSAWSSDAGEVRRGDVARFATTGAWLLIAPLLAVERGHNILNDQDAAAIGAAYFLVRPLPRPDDISFAVHSINRWAIDMAKRLGSEGAAAGSSPDSLGHDARQRAYARWRFLLQLPMVYSTLPHGEREAVIWNQMVSIWQVIGRLVRGGSPARIHFVDAAFAPRVAAYEGTDDASSSLLVGMRQVLEPYFAEKPNPSIAAQECSLVKILYGPLYSALTQIQGV